MRVYQHADVRNGLFAEAGVSVLWNRPKFEENGSDVNFLNEFGIGYQFKSNWHVTAKFEHISNASTASHNAGTNAYGLAIGRTF